MQGPSKNAKIFLKNHLNNAINEKNPLRKVKARNMKIVQRIQKWDYALKIRKIISFWKSAFNIK